tara:strand:- start:466 stop:849 length:384 start_codon:yes stop_codon:yes gene_type:complete
MAKINKILIASLAMLIISSCASGPPPPPPKYKPIGMISRVEPGTYTTTVYGLTEKDATEKANKDAKGICQDNHDEEYFSIVSTDTEDLSAKSEDKGSGIAGALGGMMKIQQNQGKENAKVVLTFKCG